MTNPVLINALAAIPHTDGQLVLHARRPDFDVRIQFESGSYFVYAFVCREGKHHYTRLAAPRPTVKSARDLAARAWAEGEEFDIISGSSRRSISHEQRRR